MNNIGIRKCYNKHWFGIYDKKSNLQIVDFYKFLE